jgi:1,4-alpha-glucan branching enzyme
MIKKQYLKSRPICKVTFSLPAEVEAGSAHIVGDFNNWESSATPMTQLKDGRFKAVLELEQGNAYEFRYLLDENEWINEAEADDYAPNPFAGENSVIRV